MMVSLLELEAIVRKAVARYNRFRSPEAIAKLVKVSTESVSITISGVFCASCGVLGYIEGFIAVACIKFLKKVKPEILEVIYVD